MVLAMTVEFNPVDRGRALVQGAYSEHRGPVGSPMDIFSGKGRDQRESVLKPSKQTAGLSPTRIYASETRRQKTAQRPKSSGLSNQRILEVIQAAPKIEFLWISYVYNPMHAVKDESRGHLFKCLWDRYRATYLKGCRAETHGIAHNMALIQIDHCRTYRDFEYWDSRQPAQLESATADQWRKTLQPHWCAIRNLFETVDREALTRVSDKI